MKNNHIFKICSTWILFLLMHLSLGCSLAWYRYLEDENYAIQKYQGNLQEINTKKLINWGVYGGKQILDKITFHHFQFGDVLKGADRYLDVYIPTNGDEHNIMVVESAVPLTGTPSAILLINVPARGKGLPDIFFDNLEQTEQLISVYPQKILVDMQDIWAEDEMNAGKIPQWLLEHLDWHGIPLSSHLQITTIQTNSEWIVEDMDSQTKYFIKEMGGKYAVYIYLNGVENIVAIFHLDIEIWKEEKLSLVYAIKEENAVWQWHSIECNQEKFSLEWVDRSQTTLFAKNIWWYLQHTGFLISAPVDIVWSPIWLPYVISPGLPTN